MTRPVNEQLLKPNWDWLMTVLDSTEAQLRFGSALAGVTDPASHGLRQYQQQQQQAAQPSQRSGLERLGGRHTIASLTGERSGLSTGASVAAGPVTKATLFRLSVFFGSLGQSMSDDPTQGRHFFFVLFQALFLDVLLQQSPTQSWRKLEFLKNFLSF